MVPENACDAYLNLCYYTAFFATNILCWLLKRLIPALFWYIFLSCVVGVEICQGDSYQNVTYSSQLWHLWLSLNRGYLIANVNNRGEFSIRKGYWGWRRQYYQAFCYRAGLSYWEKCPYRGLSHLGQCYHWRWCSTTLCSCLWLCNCQDRSCPGAWSCPVLQCRSLISCPIDVCSSCSCSIYLSPITSFPSYVLIGELSQVHSKCFTKQVFY